MFVYFGGFSSLNLAGIQQSGRIFIGRGKGQPPQQGGGTTMATRMGPCRSAAGRWVRVRGRANFLKGGDPLLPLSLRPCMWFWQKQI